MDISLDRSRSPVAYPGSEQVIPTKSPRLLLWLTGLSGSGKSTIANALAERLRDMNLKPYVLDGDVLRHGLNADLGFTDADRRENIRRAAHVAALLMEAGAVVITALISPFRADRAFARQLVGDDAFVETYVRCPLEVCEARDPKGLYRRARAGLIPEFTGIDSPYEPPLEPAILLPTDELSLAECVATVERRLRQLGFVPPVRARVQR